MRKNAFDDELEREIQQARLVQRRWFEGERRVERCPLCYPFEFLDAAFLTVTPPDYGDVGYVCAESGMIEARERHVDRLLRDALASSTCA